VPSIVHSVVFSFFFRFLKTNRLNFKEYQLFLLFFYGCEIWSLSLGKKDTGILTVWCQVRYLGLRGKKEDYE
jgi:hypothetical protein